MNNQWIILDRDGVINLDSSNYIKSASEWIPIEGSIEAIASLSSSGRYRITVATNQSGLARGLFSQDDLDAMHRKMYSLIHSAGGELAGVFYCPHGPDDGCDCRKPKTGLLTQIITKLNANIKGSDFVGDSLRDLQCAQTMGCQPILVRTGKGKKTEAQIQQIPELSQTPIFDSLADYARWRLKSAG